MTEQSVEVAFVYHGYTGRRTSPSGSRQTCFYGNDRFEALPDGSTHVRDAIEMRMSIPRFIRSAALMYVLITQYHFDNALALGAPLEPS